MPQPTNLDDANQLSQLDQSNVYGSVVAFPNQCSDAFEQTQTINVPNNYRHINQVLMTGMGGSGLGARIIESVYGSELKIPLLRLNDYHLPSWVDEHTLVFVSSYSGTTEEVIHNAHEVIAKKAPWIAIAAGGELIKLAQSENVPYYLIRTKFNPSNQPRMAVGYSVFGQLNFAAKAGLFKLNQALVDQVVQTLHQLQDSLKVEVPTDKNPAKLMAQALYQKCIIFVASRHLYGSAHTVKNQSNENAKNFSALFPIPELNHHLMEGLTHPQSNPDNLAFLMFESNLYEDRLKQRYILTKDVLQQNGISVHSWEAIGDNPLAQAFSVIQFGAFVVFYLSMLNGINPAPIPWVDYFKTKLGQPLGFHA